MVRSARLLTDKVQDIVGSIFTRTELSEVLTEIVKMDPKFDKEQFLKDCESDFIPNILEAISREGGGYGVLTHDFLIDSNNWQ